MSWSTPVVTSLVSGGSTAISAETGSITGTGAQIAAGFNASGQPVATADASAGNVLLSAAKDISLSSAQSTSRTDSSSTSKSASVGYDFASQSFSASAAYSNDKTAATSSQELDSHVTGTGTVALNSGNDTSLKGAVVTGETVIANVGGDLAIESRQDASRYREKSTSVSGGISSSGVTVGANRSAVKGDFANVAEQSGIVAGAGGYHVAVGGGVDLKAGVIASSAEKDKNALSADHLTYSNLDNVSKASSSGFGLSVGIGADGKPSIPTPSVSQPAKEEDSGRALATLTPGALTLDNQKQDLSGLNTDLGKANTTVTPYDIDRLKAKQESAAALSELLNGLTGDLSEKLHFAEGSPEKIALHTAVGAIVAKLAGGDIAAGAVAGAASEIANGVLQEALKANPNLSDADSKAITQWVAVMVGAAVGGQTGAATGLDNVNHNYLNHSDNEKLVLARAACEAGDQAACSKKEELEKKDADQQQQFVDCRLSGFGGAGCDQVLKDAVVALSSYSGVASFLLSAEDRMAILKSDGSEEQIVKILAPEGIEHLSASKRDELEKTIGLLTGDPTGITGLPALLDEIYQGDPSAWLQTIGFLLKSATLKGLGKVADKTGTDGGRLPSGYRELGSVGATGNTTGGLPNGYRRVVAPSGDIEILAPSGRTYASADDLPVPSGNFSGSYEPNPKHDVIRPGVSPQPTNPEKALADSIPIGGNSAGRIAYDSSTGEIVLFQNHQGSSYHGYTVSWGDLRQVQKNALINAGLFKPNGKPK